MFQRGYDNELGEFELATCNTQGDLFADCQHLEDYPCDAYDFITKFMAGEIAKDMDRDVSMCHTWGTDQIYETFFYDTHIEKHNGNVYIDSDTLFWAGYLFRYWVWWLGDSSNEIINKVSAELVCSTYIGLHTVDPKQAIVMLKDAVKWVKTL